jgi:hypothetical protein
MIRDRFGAKEKRYSDARCICFDLDKILRNYEDYVKEDKPTKIVCKPIDKDDANDANDANIESLFKSFGYWGGAPSANTSIIDESKIEDKVSVQYQDMNPKMKTEQSFSSTPSQGLKNCVISVIPVIEPHSRNNLKSCGVNEIDVQDEDYMNNIYRKWNGSDIWACYNCNDSGDKPYMLKHLCKNNRK